MNLLNPFRLELSRIPYLNDLIDAIMAKINAVWNVQHKGDGTHGDVTADSVTLASDPLTGDWDGNVGASLVPTVNGVDLGATIISSGNVSRDHPFRDIRLSRRLYFTPYSESGVGTYGYLEAAAGGQITAYTAGSAFRIPLIDTDLITSVGGYIERGRGLPLGEWDSPTFSAGNFTASSGSWTVDSGDVTTYAYTLVGKTMTVIWRIVNTDVSANSVLRLAIPGSNTAAAFVRGLHTATDAGGAEAVAQCRVQSGNGYIELFATVGGGVWTITAADNTAVEGSLTFPIT